MRERMPHLATAAAPLLPCPHISCQEGSRRGLTTSVGVLTWAFLADFRAASQPLGEPSATFVYSLLYLAVPLRRERNRPKRVRQFSVDFYIRGLVIAPATFR